MILKLLELREEKNVPQDTLAALLGVTRQAYSRYERGERELGYNSLIKLAQYFDVSIDYLLNNTSYYYPDKLNQSYSDKELELISNYRKLPQQSQEYVYGIIQNLAVHS